MRGAKPTYQTARPEGSLVFRPFRPGVWNRSPSKPKPSSVPRPFLGRPLSRPASLTDDPETIRSRVALEEDRLFRRLFPAGPASAPRSFNIACRRRSDLWSPAASSFRCRLSEEAGTAVPITHAPCTPSPSRGSEKCGEKPVDNVDIGHNLGNLFQAPISAALRLPFRSPLPTSFKCLNHQPSSPIRHISRV